MGSLKNLCGIHRAQLRRRPGTEPRPCRKCNRGSKSETQLCSRGCGADNAKKALHRAEAKARRLHPARMHELLLAAHRQRILPFIGLRLALKLRYTPYIPTELSIRQTFGCVIRGAPATNITVYLTALSARAPARCAPATNITVYRTALSAKIQIHALYTNRTSN